MVLKTPRLSTVAVVETGFDAAIFVATVRVLLDLSLFVMMMGFGLEEDLNFWTGFVTSVDNPPVPVMVVEVGSSPSMVLTTVDIGFHPLVVFVAVEVGNDTPVSIIAVYSDVDLHLLLFVNAPEIDLDPLVFVTTVKEGFNLSAFVPASDLSLDLLMVATTVKLGFDLLMFMVVVEIRIDPPVLEAVVYPETEFDPSVFSDVIVESSAKSLETLTADVFCTHETLPVCIGAAKIDFEVKPPSSMFSAS
ncbi:hypothetical protein R1flu_000802 [Riccia fluitans]|uniref:Uncharacterized protein n=1 Tax=Riccia fluitans TaxID=41844 RepID=A0ABD1Y4M6_9MARC